ncbi:MAG: 50S ribosomal protein L25/general stress protein Ctc [Elainellaceae cyanobacterium]
MELTVECQKRPEGSKSNTLRREGRLPAVLYGHDGANSVSLTMDAKDAEILVRKASLNNTLIRLNVADLPWSGQALLREVQAHPWRGNLYHLSFFSIGSQATVQVTVPLHFTGTPVGVKTEGGALDTVLTELEVSCAPGSIPETIEIDVSDMRIGDALHVNELALPAGVEVVGEAERVVASILGRAGQTSTSEESTTEDIALAGPEEE